MSSLLNRTSKGLIWSYLDSFGVYVIKFGFTISIARLLSPSDYGLMGMLFIFIAIGQLLSESGFGMALIYKSEDKQTDSSTIFWFNFVVGILVYVIIYFSSSAISAFYTEPILADIIKISALNIVFSSLTTVHVALLSKKYNFKKQTIINFISAMLSGSTGLYFAANNFGVWALVYMTLTGSVSKVIGFWFLSNWRPKMEFSFDSLKELYNYSYKIFLSGLSDIIFTKMYFPLIGKYYSATDLGYYTQSTRFYDIFVKRVTISYGRVIFPAMSSLKNDSERFNFIYEKIFALLIFILFPFTVFLLISANPFIYFFLTEKWASVIPFMVLFFIDGFIFPLYMHNINTLNAIGRSDLPLKIELVKKSFYFVSMLIALNFGIYYLILGQIISSFFIFIICLFIINKIRQINYINLIKDASVTFTLAMASGSIFYYIINYFSCSFGHQLLIITIFYPILYLGLSKLWNDKLFSQFIGLITGLINNKQNNE